MEIEIFMKRLQNKKNYSLPEQLSTIHLKGIDRGKCSSLCLMWFKGILYYILIKSQKIEYISLYAWLNVGTGFRLKMTKFIY